MKLRKKSGRIWAYALTAALLTGAMQIPALQTAAAEGNLARVPGTTASASSSEEAYGRGPDKLNDGISDDSGNRWAQSGTGSSAWVQYEWSEPQTVKSFRVVWERRTAESWQLEISDDGTVWKRISTALSTPEKTTSEITLDEAETAKYLRLHITSINGGTIDGMAYQSVSILEFEVYKTDIPDPDPEHAQQVNGSLTGIEKILADLKPPSVKKGDDKIFMPKIDGAQVHFRADYEQIIGEDGTVYTPLADKTVKGFYEIKTDKETMTSDEYAIVVPGTYENEGENIKPDVIPSLQEWHGGTGDFILSKTGRIIAESKELMETAAEFAGDYKDLLGMDITVVSGTRSDAGPGDFCLSLTKEKQGLGKEGYTVAVGSFVSIEAEETTGAYWATRSVLQILKRNRDRIPKGLIRDYPKYEVRALNLDVARKPFTMQALKDFARNMSWYKLNSFQVHLSDNLIFLEDYSNGVMSEEMRQNAIDHAYAGFRLESGKTNAEGKSAASEDVWYTKDEFRRFIKESRKIGVDIVPEIDMPAHALAFTRVFPEYMSEGYNPTQAANGKYRYLIDELDISKKGAIDLVKELWADYFDGPDPVFDAETTVHIGTDEFLGGGEESGEAFRVFSDELIRYVQSRGRKVRLWGSLSNKSGTTEVTSDGVQANIWSQDYGTAADMHRLGFDLINTQDTWMYMVPDGSGRRGAYTDYLDIENMYKNWEINTMFNYTIPAGDDQLLGACFAIWHDNIDTRANGYSQYDALLRYIDTAPVFSEKLWGDASETCEYEAFVPKASAAGLAPNTMLGAENDYLTGTIANYTFEVTPERDESLNQHHLTKLLHASVENTDLKTDQKALRLTGKESYAETPFDMLEPGSVLTLNVKMDADADTETSEQILCESKETFGTGDIRQLDVTDRNYALKASVNYSGKVGFSREGYGYMFDYVLPKGEWTELSFHSGVNGQVSLYVNGTLTDSNPNLYYKNHPETKKKGIHTLLIPFGRIGSETDSFQGQISYAAVNGTRKTSGNNAVTKQELKEKIETYQTMTSDRYTDASWAAYEKTCQNALQVLNFEGSLDRDYAYAWEQCKKAEEALREKTQNQRLSEELYQTVHSAEELLKNTAGYTKDSIHALNSAIAAAKAALAGCDATDDVIAGALSALKGSALEKEKQNTDANAGIKDGDFFEERGMKYQAVSAAFKTARLVKGKDAAKVTVHTVTYDGRQYNVTEISAGAFQNCRKKLKKVTIGASVESIGKNAFKGCKKLKTVAVKNKSALKKVGSGAFRKTAKGIAVKLPKSLKKAKSYKNLKKQIRKAGISKGLL